MWTSHQSQVLLARQWHGNRQKEKLNVCKWAVETPKHGRQLDISSRKRTGPGRRNCCIAITTLRNRTFTTEAQRDNSGGGWGTGKTGPDCGLWGGQGWNIAAVSDYDVFYSPLMQYPALLINAFLQHLALHHLRKLLCQWWKATARTANYLLVIRISLQLCYNHLLHFFGKMTETLCR